MGISHLAGDLLEIADRGRKTAGCGLRIGGWRMAKWQNTEPTIHLPSICAPPAFQKSIPPPPLVSFSSYSSDPEPDPDPDPGHLSVHGLWFDC